MVWLSANSAGPFQPSAEPLGSPTVKAPSESKPKDASEPSSTNEDWSFFDEHAVIVTRAREQIKVIK